MSTWPSGRADFSPRPGYSASQKQRNKHWASGGYTLVVLLSASQQELAAQIGTVRELVSLNLARLHAQGFISITGREVTIVDEAGLEADLGSTV